jgi:hypothetical protein
VLIGLTAVAVMKFLGRNPALRNRMELGQLEAAVATFTQHFRLGKKGYIPSRLALCESYADYQHTLAGQDQLWADSLQYLQRLFPRLWREPYSQQVVIKWSGQPGTTPNPPVVLEGDQCLIFFLGGIPSLQGGSNSCLGFSRLASNPAAPGGDRIGPFYDFESSRLQALHADGTFFSYLDVYRQRPYLYFSSYGQHNGYNKYRDTYEGGHGFLSDCFTTEADPSLTVPNTNPFFRVQANGTYPYAIRFQRQPGSVSAAQFTYVNPDTFQIISAGVDGKFGRGTDINQAEGSVFWNPTSGQCSTDNATTTSQIPPDYQDDQSNFARNLIGQGQ